jgi:bifunctional UDP-N-acetylglucosamine pyrophosphorylase/glucosamine-1-phosphate N-acetyltransferase
LGDLAAVILAAGKGTRMRSRLPKVLHALAGRPLIHYPLDLARAVGARPVVVVLGHGAQAVKERLEGDDLEVVIQEPQLGTGHALNFAAKVLGGYRGDLLILCGDMPLLSAETLEGLVRFHRETGSALTVLVGEVEEPTGYGRVVRGEGGRILKIVEERDASPREREIREVNSGTYCAQAESLFSALESLGCENAQAEYYLTDLVELLSGQGVLGYKASDEEELLGVNDRADLARAERIVQQRLRLHWMRQGVSFLDPASVFMDSRVRLGPDTLIEPQVLLLGHTVVGRDCRIGAGSCIEDSVIEDGVIIRPHCVIAGSRIASGATVGPFAHLRPGADIGPEARVGNFVEIKNSTLGKGSKASHLSYLGDAQIGEHVNIGAGTITCNYDGLAKHKTIIEDRVFVGSDTQLVAPVRVGEGAVLGAGSTITEDVPPGALALARARQVNLPGRAQGRKKRKS